jgi:plastocyanin
MILRAAVLFVLVSSSALAQQARRPPAVAAAPAPAAAPVWLGEHLPLPLPVKTPEELPFKAGAERQYLIFNLMASGKVAYDKGDWAAAAEKWEALLRVPSLPADVDTAVRPLALLARGKAGGAPTGPIPELPVVPVAELMSPPPEAPAVGKRTAVSVSGTVTGGGPNGPGGAVVMLRRADGTTPKPRPGRVRAILQKDKRFVPRVLAVPQGSTVEFRNEDEILHNVFSLTKPNDFDLGLYAAGITREQVFPTAGAVHLLCNIHTSMQGWIYVSDTPWFGQVDGNGKFTIRGVPPGEYAVEVWHELASKPTQQKVRITESSEPLALTVAGDLRPSAFVPDKSGKPRQPQLGY